MRLAEKISGKMLSMLVGFCFSFEKAVNFLVVFFFFGGFAARYVEGLSVCFLGSTETNSTNPTDQPDQPAHETRSALPQYPTGFAILLFITGWNCPKPTVTGRVAERTETRLNRPVLSPNEIYSPQ
jgi:hypothetical protein